MSKAHCETILKILAESEGPITSSQIFGELYPHASWMLGNCLAALSSEGKIRHKREQEGSQYLYSLSAEPSLEPETKPEVDFSLAWEETWDDDDNSIWEATSPYHDDGSHFRWRIHSELIGNKIQWSLFTSDSETLLPEDEDERFASDDEAKAFVGKRLAEILADKSVEWTAADAD